MEIAGYTVTEFIHRWKLGWFRDNDLTDIINDFINYVPNEDDLMEEISDLKQTIKQLEKHNDYLLKG